MSQYQIYITSSTLPSIHPNQDVFPFTIGTFPQTIRDEINNNVAIGVGFTNTDNFIGEVLNHTISSSFVSPSSPIGNKIRIIDNQTEGNILNPYLKIEKKSSFDELLDTNELFVGFSQTKQIDKDIIAQLGTYFSLDQYIGEPSYQYDSSYDELRGIRKYYFSKYQGKNNINSFINLVSKYDHSVLSLVEKIIPGRTNTTLGTTIEPSVLERSKVARLEPTVSNNSYSSSINLTPTSSGEILILEKTIEGIRFQSSSNIVDNNLDNYSPSNTYRNKEGIPANYMSGMTLSPSSIYGQSQGLSYLSNPLITNPNPTSNLIYIFDSLIPYKIPLVNFSPRSNQMVPYLITSSRGFEDLRTGSLVPSLQTNKIEFKIGLDTFRDITSSDITMLLTSSYFNIPAGSLLKITGLFSQPNLGAFNLGITPSLGTSSILDTCDSLDDWTIVTPSSFFTVQTGSGSFPYPSSSNSTYIEFITTNGYTDYTLRSKFYPSPSNSTKIRVSFYLTSLYSDGSLNVSIIQGGRSRAAKSFSASELFYNSENQERFIEFNSISSSFTIQFSNSYTSAAPHYYKIDTISTASYDSGYLAPSVKISIVSGSYDGIDGTTEIISTGEIEAPTSNIYSELFNKELLIGTSSINDAFLEVRFNTSKSLFSTSPNAGIFYDIYNSNPISINNLLIDTGETLEKYAFRIEKTVNINTENIPSSEIINKDEEYFVSFIDNELTPSFKFSITSFADFPNRLKDSYHIFTASFGSRKDLVERGNLIGRNYIPIDLSIGETEEDDLPNFYNFDGGGVIIPLNISEEFKTNKQSIIEFSKTVKNNNSLTF
jgi:hypothetical protein